MPLHATPCHFRLKRLGFDETPCRSNDLRHSFVHFENSSKGSTPSISPALAIPHVKPTFSSFIGILKAQNSNIKGDSARGIVITSAFVAYTSYSSFNAFFPGM
jgi:hypothetical protein